MSYIDLANEALALIGTRSTISALDENSVESIEFSRCYVKVRRQLLRAAPWNFARRFATLGLLKALPGTPENTDPMSETWLASYPPPPWLYTYAYPNDCLLLRYIVPQENNAGGVIPLYSENGYTSIPLMDRWAKFAVISDNDDDGNEIRAIATNAPQAIACYTRDTELVDVWDPIFERAYVSAVAGAMTMALTGKRALQGDLYKMADSIIMNARAQDGNEGLTIADHVPDWIRTRGINYAPQWSDIPLTAWGPLFSSGGFS